MNNITGLLVDVHSGVCVKKTIEDANQELK